MERFAGCVAVVTGSSAGIGLAIVKELLKKDLIVVGLARREDKLRTLKEEFDKDGYTGKYFPFKCDVTNEQDVISVFERITSEVGNISILVNNAGKLTATNIHEISGDEYDTVFDTNVKGLVMCAKQAIKNMKENSIHGHIVNLCSIAGQPGWLVKPIIAMYSSSKHAVKVITDGLRREMVAQKTLIKVSALSPGLVNTDMTTKYLPQGLYQFISPEDIAQACIAILNTPPGVVISELTVLPQNEMI